MESDSQGVPAEIAHVLFMDIVEYSRLSMEGQAGVVRELRDLVRALLGAGPRDDLLKVDTGDGMALVFFGDPQAPVQCAHQMAQALGAPPRLRLRMGVHTGPVSRVTDINESPNVSGGGINLAQRVMGCGGTGHILLSQASADVLRQFDRWAPLLHDVGWTEVKHGERLHLFNLYGDGFGNPEPPPMRGLSSLPPNNLPLRSTEPFLGREGAMAELRQALDSPGRAPVALVGMGGVGKTRLALEYAYAHLSDWEYRGGVFWVNGRDSLRLKDDYAALGRQYFGIPNDLPTERCVERMREILQRRPGADPDQRLPSLLIVDDVTQGADLRLLPSSGLCRILVTTREDFLVRPWFRTVAPTMLDEESALALLVSGGSAERQRGLAESLEQNPAERAAALRIARSLGRLPLALAVVAHHLGQVRYLNFARFAERLENRTPTKDRSRTFEVLRHAHAEFYTATGHSGDIYDTIALSYAQLQPQARSLLAAASCFAGRDISPALLLDAFQANPRTKAEKAHAEFEAALANLAGYGLVTWEKDDRLSVHELVRAFAHAQMSGANRCAVLRRVVTALARRLQAANDALDWREVRREITHCHAAVGLCGGLGDRALQQSYQELLLGLGVYLLEHGETQAAQKRLEEGLRIADSLYGRQHLMTAQFLAKLGEARLKQDDGRAALAFMREALAIAKGVLAPDRPEIADYYNNVGLVLKMQERLWRALPYYCMALDISRRAYGPVHKEVASWLNNIGGWYEAKGDLPAALTHLREALRIIRAVYGPNHVKVAVRLNSIGRILGRMGAWDKALVRHRKALAINESVYTRQHPDVATSLYYRGRAEEELGRQAEARAQPEEAQRCLAAAREHYAEALTLYCRFYGDDRRCRIVRERLLGMEEVEMH